jgi:hypothetical protein
MSRLRGCIECSRISTFIYSVCCERLCNLVGCQIPRSDNGPNLRIDPGCQRSEYYQRIQRAAKRNPMSQLESDSGRSKRGTESKSGASAFALIHKATSLLIFGACLLASGCRGSETIWSAEARSPDGTMLASARTVAQSGFGTGYIGTIVYLSWAKGSQPKMEILGLSDQSEAPGAANVEMKWLTPTHLELTYKGRHTLDFEAVKCNGVDISVRDLSGETGSTPH